MKQPKILNLPVALVIAGTIASSTIAYEYLDYKRGAEQRMNKYQQEVDVLKKQQQDVLKKMKETVDTKDSQLEQLNKENQQLNNKIEELNKKLTQNIRIVATAYDLTVESCGKSRLSRGYGLTATGLNLQGKDWHDKIVAVDPDVIPLKHYIYVVFDNPEYKYLNGWWYTGDTGSAVKGNVVDFYLGEDGIALKVDRFGRQGARITSISKEKV